MVRFVLNTIYNFYYVCIYGIYCVPFYLELNSLEIYLKLHVSQPSNRVVLTLRLAQQYELLIYKYLGSIYKYIFFKINNYQSYDSYRCLSDWAGQNTYDTTAFTHNQLPILLKDQFR